MTSRCHGVRATGVHATRDADAVVALEHDRHVGRTRAGTEIVSEQIRYVDHVQRTRLRSGTDAPRESGWRIETDPDLPTITGCLGDPVTER